MCNDRNKRFKPVYDWLNNESELQKKSDLCQMALANAKELKTYSSQLKSAWSFDERNYTFELLNGQQFESFDLALENLSHALYTIEFTKDIQLGRPLGLHSDCTDTSGTCPNLVEHKWSDLGLEGLNAKFIGFKKVFEDGGLGEYMSARGLNSSYENLSQLTDQIIKTINELKITGTMNSYVAQINPVECQATTTTDRKVAVCALQKEVRALTQAFKSDYFAVFSFDPPATSQGDAD